jgi:hypothetical protein
MALIEIRQFLRRFTLEDLKSGIQPIRQFVGPAVNGVAPIELFAPPVLQYRVKERNHVDGKPTLEWTDWQDANYVREGDGEPTA